MGIVYAARDERLQRTVALKTMSSLAQGRNGAAPLLARGPRRRQRQPSQRLPDLRDRRRQRAALHRDGAARGRGVVRPPAARCAGPRRGHAHRPRHAVGSLRAARRRHRPSRSQAVERVPDRPRREAARLRPGASRAGGSVQHRHGHGSDPRRRDRRHAALHGAGADQRRDRGLAQRPLRGRRDPLRDARGPAGVRRPIDRGDPARDAVRAAAGAHRIAGGRGRGPRRSGGRSGEASRRAAGLGHGDGRRTARDQRHRRPRHRHAWRTRSRAWSCCRSACCGRIRKPTSWPSACPTPSRRRSAPPGRSCCGRAPSPRALRPRRPISRRWRPRRTSTAWSWARCCGRAISSACRRSSSRRRAARS